MEVLRECEVNVELGFLEAIGDIDECQYADKPALFNLLHSMQECNTLQNITTFKCTSHNSDPQQILDSQESSKLMRYIGQMRNLQSLELDLPGSNYLWTEATFPIDLSLTSLKVPHMELPLVAWQLMLQHLPALQQLSLGCENVQVLDVIPRPLRFLTFHWSCDFIEEIPTAFQRRLQSLELERFTLEIDFWDHAASPDHLQALSEPIDWKTIILPLYSKPASQQDQEYRSLLVKACEKSGIDVGFQRVPWA